MAVNCCSTDTGRVVFERGQAILASSASWSQELSDINHPHKGVLRLGIPPMVGMLMAEPISRFRERYPGVELKIAEFGGLTVQQAVSNGELDMAMTALPIEEGSHLTTLPLFNHPLCVLTPRTAPWEGRDLALAGRAGGVSAGHLQRRICPSASS